MILPLKSTSTPTNLLINLVAVLLVAAVHTAMVRSIFAVGNLLLAGSQIADVALPQPAYRIRTKQSFFWDRGTRQDPE
jgi:hypothetical protein